MEVIMNHEREHIQQRHWLDLLLVELMCIVQWFNPFAWIYVHLVRQNHEYLADEQAFAAYGRSGHLSGGTFKPVVGSPCLQSHQLLQLFTKQKKI